MGFTTDIYSLYFAPVGMITGFMAGIAAKQMHGLVFEKQVKKLQIIIGALFITIPGTMVSSVTVSYTHLDVYKRQEVAKEVDFSLMGYTNLT